MLGGCGALAPASRVGPTQKLIGYLYPGSTAVVASQAPGVPPPDPADPFWRALRVHGWEIGQNLVVEHRAGSTTGRGTPLFAGLARELVELDVALMLTAGEAATRAARDATTTTPIVCFASFDPVASGLVGGPRHRGLRGPERGADDLPVPSLR
jgi:hypothetical protein